MTSQLRRLQQQWNELVPQAQARGLRGVREIRLYPEGLHERIPHRRGRLEWLRRELQIYTGFTPVPTAVAQQGEFTFGVELECLMPQGMARETISAEINLAGVQCQVELYNHSVRRFWKVVTDGSLGDYIRGIELVSPILTGEDGFEQVRKVCETLDRLGCKVTKRCGLHVHVGARNEPVVFFKNLVKLYAKAEPMIDAFLAPSRRLSNNVFCRAVQVNGSLEAASTVDAVARTIGQSSTNARGAGRYCKLNLQSFWQHGTVEFRHHQGTVDGQKAINWIRFCLRMAAAARKENMDISTMHTLEALMATIGANEQETAYFTHRTNYFTRRAA